jgi:hypothetical protein
MKCNFLNQEVTFDGKPSAAIRSALKARNFRWSPGRGLWWFAGRGHAAGLTADFAEWLAKQGRQDAGFPARPDGDCWTCKGPGGFFRHHGPAAPVICDACHEACAYCAEQRRLHSPEPMLRDPGEDAADRWCESHG